MRKSLNADFAKRFRRRVLLPGALVLLLTAALCGGSLITAGRGTDELSLRAQTMEVWRGLGRGLDDLSLQQESIGLCNQCIEQAAADDPDETWLHATIGSRLYDLADAHSTYILDGHDRPIYASHEGEPAPAHEAYREIAPQLDRFIALARGESKRPSGFSNINERLPDSPEFPLSLLPGAEDAPEGSPATVNTARTRDATIHATDLVAIGGRVALASAMRMAHTPAEGPAATADAPILVNLRYIDSAFLTELSTQNFLVDPRITMDGSGGPGEHGIPLTNSDGAPLGQFFWKPLLGGSMLVKQLLPPAAGMFTVISLMVLFLALRMRRLMKQDDIRLSELKRAHYELQAKEAQAHHLAYHDVLTGLPNRALFNDKADQALLRTRHGEEMAILLLDLDRFKNVNDRFGHLAGDELIQTVAKRLTKLLDEDDLIARLGGDEFAILLQGWSSEEELEATLERILKEIHWPYELLGNQAHIGVSIGIALAPKYGTDRTELMRKADIALYRAKDKGRACYRFFTESMDETVQLRASIEADLRTAIESGDGLNVHYQTLIDSDGRKITGLEALLRWDHPQKGWIAPHLFVPVAEETGLISALGDWVLQEACRTARAWPNLTIAINLSPVQFCDEDFAERVCRIVDEAGVSPQQIELEVTEGVVLDQNDTVRGAVRRLRNEGFRIALDDFGTGYSSLSYLREFEVDRIKIDKSFVQNLGLAMDADAIISAVVTLGHAMGLQVTAEGVETADQEDFLRNAGCNVLQGWRFSKAVPANELAEAMAGHLQNKAA